MDAQEDEDTLRRELARLRGVEAELSARLSHAEEQLRASQALHAATIESLPFDFWARDREGYPPLAETIDDPMWLRERWHDDQLPQDQIARLAGVSPRTVRYRLAFFEIEQPAVPTPRAPRAPAPFRRRNRRSSFPNLNDRASLRNQLDERRSIRSIAHEIGCDPGTVSAALRRHHLRPARDPVVSS